METTTFTSYSHPFTLSVLDNGLTVATVPNKETIGFHCRYVIRAGGFSDPIPGTAHFLEHLIYTGPSRKGIHPLLRSHMLKGGDGNAGTNLYSTSYYVNGLLEHLEEALNGLCTLCTQPSFTRQLVKEERDIIIEEERARGRDPYNSWEEAMLYPTNLRLQIPLPGSAIHIEAIRYEELMEFYGATYRSGNALLIVSGNIEHERILELAAKQPQLPEGERTQPPPDDAPRLGTWTCRNPEMKPRVIVYTAMPQDEVAGTRTLMALDYLTDPAFGPLYYELRQRERIIYSLKVRDHGKPFNELGLQIAAPSSKLAFICSRVYAHLSDLRDGNVNEDSFMRLKALTQLQHDSRNERSVGGVVEAITRHWVHDELNDSTLWPEFLATTREDLVDVARKHLHLDNLGTIFVYDRDE